MVEVEVEDSKMEGGGGSRPHGGRESERVTARVRGGWGRNKGINNTTRENGHKEQTEQTPGRNTETQYRLSDRINI